MLNFILEWVAYYSCDFLIFWMDINLFCAPSLPGVVFPYHNCTHTLVHISKTTLMIFLKLWDIVPNNIRVTNLHYQKNMTFWCFHMGDPNIYLFLFWNLFFHAVKEKFWKQSAMKLILQIKLFQLFHICWYILKWICR